MKASQKNLVTAGKERSIVLGLFTACSDFTHWPVRIRNQNRPSNTI